MWAFFDKAEEEKEKISGVGLQVNCENAVRKPPDRSDGFLFYLVHQVVTLRYSKRMRIIGRNGAPQFIR